MAGARKLQAEVDRTLKQIGEHIAEFDLVWEKVAVAPTPNQKEKYEADLKKEIKKLQRLRDACKSFIAHHDVKNKKPLLDVRKQIESKMEQFKILEKETKTKAYSKEGLSQAAKGGKGGAGAGEDEERREDSRQWLDEATEQLEAQRDELEQRWEAAREAQAGNAAKGKKKAKGGGDGQLEELQRQVQRHVWHIRKLGLIKDRLDDEQLTAEQVDAVRDAVEEFVNNNGEPDFLDDESIYEELDLSEQSGGAAEGGEGDDDDAEAAGKAAEDETDGADTGEKETEEEEEDKKAPTSPVKSRPAAGAPAAAAPSASAAAQPARPTVSVNAKTTGVINTGKVTPTNAVAAASPQSSAPATKPAAAAAASPSLITPITRITPSSSPAPAPKPVLTVGTVAGGPAAAAAAAGNGKKPPAPTVAPPPVSSLPAVKPMESLASIVMKGGRADEQRRGAAAGSVNTVTPLTAITPVAASGANTAAALVARPPFSASLSAPNPGSKPAPAPAAGSVKAEQQQQQPASRPPLIAPMKITTSTPSASPSAISSSTPTNASSASISSAPSTPSFTSTPPSPSPVSAAVSAPSSVAPAAAPSSMQPSVGLSAPPSRPSSSASVSQPADEPTFASSLQPQQLPMFVNSIPLPAATLPAASTQPVPLPSSAGTLQPAGFEHHTPYSFPSSSPPAAPSAATPALSSISSSSSSSSPPSSSLPSPLSKDRERGLIPDDYFYTLSLLESSLSLTHFPHPSDTDRPKPYTPRNPYRTPPYFPSSPPPLFDDPQLFEKLSVDTLFFIFYFQQGTPHQYLAARELKKQSWRYHKNFLTWFQRHDDPKLTSDEYEQGTYVYFDYESGWCQRIKADFTFEYRHLECEDIEGIASQVTQFGRG